jgi:2-C-methyl-D-erythritol 4-phosphate cytidylyltransferase
MSVNVPNTRFFALIPCAGNGSRAGTSGPKQYEPIAGKPMVMHTLAAFAAVKRIARTLVVVAQGDGFFSRNFAPVTAAACGGETRALSVGNGLHELRRLGADSRDWVLVHDAARCLITPELIDSLIDACLDDPVGGLLAQRLPDTLKTSENGRVAQTLDREDKWLAQTPQMFRIGRLIEALEQAGDEVTDEASAIEAVGQRPLLVPGSSQNFKVTYPDDFALAEAVLRTRR